MCDDRFSGFMDASQIGCMIVKRGGVSLGSFLSSVEAGRSRVALRESIAV